MRQSQQKSSAEMFMEPPWQTVWRQIRLLLWSSLFWVHTVYFYLKFVSNVRQLFAADDFSRRHFQMHFFLGALRVKINRELIDVRNRGSYARDHFIWNLLNESSASLINVIWNDHKCKILFIIWHFKCDFIAFKVCLFRCKFALL